MKTISLSNEELESLDLASLTHDAIPIGRNDDSLQRAFARGADWHRATVRERFQLGGERALDLLSGFGRWSVFLAEVYDEVVCLDRLQEFTEIGEALAEKCEMDNIHVLRGEIERTAELSADSFDTVWMWSALQYVDRGRTLREVLRLLKPGGRLVVAAYNSTGVMIEHIVRGIEEGTVLEGASHWAIRGLARGEEDDETPNYARVEACGPLCRRFGLELIAAAPSDALDLRRKENGFVAGEVEPPRVMGHDRTIEFIAEKG